MLLRSFRLDPRASIGLVLTALLVASAAPAFAQGNAPVAIEDAHASPSIGRAANGVAYFALKSTKADRLVAAASDVAERVELHTHVREGDVMRMRKVDGVDLPAGETVRFAPGGLHVMLLNLARRLNPGDTFELTLTFEQAGKIKVPVAVRESSGGHRHGKH